MRPLKILLGGGIRGKMHKNSLAGDGIFTSVLGAELAKRGHDVSIVGVGGSEVPGCKIIPISHTEEEVMRVEENYLVHDAYQLLESQWIATNHNHYDVIHINYYHYLFAPFSKFIKKPIIYTEHLPLLTSPTWQTLLNRMSKPEDIFVFVAKHAFDKAQLIKNKRTISNGIDLNAFPFNESSKDYLFWMGRTKKKKGILDVVQVALKLAHPVIAAQVTKRPDDFALFNDEVLPMIKGANNIKFVGPMSHEGKIVYFQNAKAFLMPIHWEEPFGLVMAEAMACGTPVIAYGRGSVPEVVKDGETGFVVPPEKGVDGLIEAVKKLYAMPKEEYARMRRNCRKQVEENFTVAQMVSNYEKLYETII